MRCEDLGIFNRFCRRGLFAVLAALLTCFFIPYHDAAASPYDYGAGAYGECKYDDECPAVIAPVTMPNGLKVIINLADGQTVTQDGYKITITQLDGSTSVRFKSATISIDGREVQTVTPDESGTASWNWEPKVYPGTRVDIVVTADDNTTSTYGYTVKLASATRPVTNGGNVIGDGSGDKTTNTAADPSPLAVLKTVVPENVKQVFRGLPQTTINTFPYALVISLILVAIVVLLQVKREIVAIRRGADAIMQVELMTELKENFIGLAQHYLRTPLTLIDAGVEMLSMGKMAAADTVTKIKAAVAQLSEHVETSGAGDRPIEAAPEVPSEESGRIRIGIGLAIFALALIAIVFNLLAYASGRDIPAANIFAQIVGFVLVALVLYQVERRLLLRRGERKMQDYKLSLQRHLHDMQDTFLERTVTQIDNDYKELNTLVATLPDETSTKTIRDGMTRIYKVLYKCTTARSLKGAHTVQPIAAASAKELFDHSDTELAEHIATKKLQIVEPTDITLNMAEPALVKYAVRTLIDNAVAYSPDQSTITLNARRDGSDVVLTVADKGQGVPKDQQELLFQPFSKVEGYRQFDHEGMGFSLYLDKLIMTYLGGHIDVQSEEDQGTTVSLRLPAT